MEIEHTVILYNEINPVLQVKLHEHYKLWSENRKRKEMKDEQERSNLRKCNNCRNLFPIERTIVVRYSSRSSVRYCELCHATKNPVIRVRRK